MKRYQVYLHPQSVNILDFFEKETDISRSRVIRYVVDAAAENLTNLLVQKKKKTSITGPLDRIVGIIKCKKTTNWAEKIDEIYLKD